MIGRQWVRVSAPVLNGAGRRGLSRCEVNKLGAANSALVKPIASKADSVTPTNRKTRVRAKSVESMMNRTMPCRRKTGKLSDVVDRPARLAHEIRHEIPVEIRAMTSRKIRLLHKVDEF